MIGLSPRQRVSGEKTIMLLLFCPEQESVDITKYKPVSITFDCGNIFNDEIVMKNINANFIKVFLSFTLFPIYHLPKTLRVEEKLNIFSHLQLYLVLLAIYLCCFLM